MGCSQVRNIFAMEAGTVERSSDEAREQDRRGERHRPEQEESEKERTQRQLIELLQELRVVITGVQVLFAFLLTIPFNQRFGRVDQFQ